MIKRSKQFIQRDESFTGSEFKEIRVNSKYNGILILSIKFLTTRKLRNKHAHLNTFNKQYWMLSKDFRSHMLTPVS